MDRDGKKQKKTAEKKLVNGPSFIVCKECFYKFRTNPIGQGQDPGTSSIRAFVEWSNSTDQTRVDVIQQALPGYVKESCRIGKYTFTRGLAENWDGILRSQREYEGMRNTFMTDLISWLSYKMAEIYTENGLPKSMSTGWRH